MKYSLLIVITLFCVKSVYSQVNTEWIARYNRAGNSGDYASSLKIDALGNTYVAGSSQDPQGFEDCTVIKYNSAGILLWVQHYLGAGNGTDYLNALTLDASGNVYATGSSWSDSTARYDCLTIKYNTNGVLQWASKYNGFNLNDDGRSIVVDNSGNVYVTGKSDSAAVNSGGFMTLKYSSAGVLQWAVRKFGSLNSFDAAVSIAVDNLANVFITGSNRINPNNTDYVTIKYNSNGAEQWLARYYGPGNANDDVKSLVLDTSGNVYITGVSWGNGNSDCATIKYNSAGAQLWTARYNGSANDYDEASSIAVDAYGNVFITGRTAISPANYDMLTLKYNSSGTQQWANTYNGSGNRFDVGNEIVCDNAGNIYVTGNTQTDTIGTTDYTTIKYNTSGVLQWSKNYDGGTNLYDYVVGIKLNAFNDVFVTGSSIGPGTGYDIVTIKYSQVVAVNTISNLLPNKNKLYQNYPNPFNPSTGIRFDIPQSAIVKITIYNILGRIVQMLTNEFKTAGSYEINFDASTLASGTYFYKITAGNFTDIRKMVLLK
ncbi:MAG: SBBP repeat-containing protein [Ignavibacteria bacterium]